MKLTIRKTGLAGALAVGLATAVVPALPAFAAVPNCVKFSVDDNRRSDTVTVTNTCDSPESVKIVWAYETDSQCEYLAGGLNDSFSSTRDFPARFDGLESC